MAQPVTKPPGAAWQCPRCAARGPVEPPEMWQYPTMQTALADRNIALMYRIMQRHGWSQRRIANAVGQSETSEVLGGRRVRDVAVIERIADGLQVPRGWIGVAFTGDDS